eukprot:scaffold213100_cov30-Tisochrysis_lutea.AAC.3
MAFTPLDGHTKQHTFSSVSVRGHLVRRSAKTVLLLALASNDDDRVIMADRRAQMCERFTCRDGWRVRPSAAQAQP